MQVCAIALFPIEHDVTLAEFRARLRKKGFRCAANADASHIHLSWTPNADDCVGLPTVGSETALIKADTYVMIDLAA